MDASRRWSALKACKTWSFDALLVRSMITYFSLPWRRQESIASGSIHVISASPARLRSSIGQNGRHLFNTFDLARHRVARDLTRQRASCSTACRYRHKHATVPHRKQCNAWCSAWLTCDWLQQLSRSRIQGTQAIVVGRAHCGRLLAGKKCATDRDDVGRLAASSL